MLRLVLRNPVPAHLPHHYPFPQQAANSPWKPRIHRATQRRFHLVCLPQKDGSFVASVVEAPNILVYGESREIAEQQASRKFLQNPDPHAYLAHPLARTRVVNMDMQYDEDTRSFVTFVKELHRMSTFGDDEMEALDNTAEMIPGYIKSMEANRKQIPLSVAKLAALKRLVGMH
jgi:predicted RNase H-like HicB family nuclease